MDQIDQIIAGVNAGQGTLGKLIKDEAIYNDARTAIARFNTTAERIDNVVAGAQRGEGTVGKLITDESLYNNVNQLLVRRREDDLRLPPEPEEVPDDQVPVVETESARARRDASEYSPS